MVDITSLVLLAASFFFVAISFALLVRYRQVSQRINASTDMGKDLWSSLERRLKKQDERIIDMMGRVEVIQARMTAAPSVQAPVGVPLAPVGPASPAPQVAESAANHVPGPAMQQGESQVALGSPRVLGAPRAPSALDETQLAAIRLLSESPKNTRQLTDSLSKSREHTARIMKGLFESGLVKRNDASKPFVYELTDEGRRLLPNS